MFRSMLASLVAIGLSVAPTTALYAASPQPVTAEHGMVVTAQHLASDVGIDILKSGGNAVDAAVAVGYALAVVYPDAGNIGGGGFMTIRLKDGKAVFLDFRERAPKAATEKMYLDAKGDVVKGLSTDGFLAVGVPGSVMGLETARIRYGTKSRAELMAPAIRYAREGFVLDKGDVASLENGMKRLSQDKAASAIFIKSDGNHYQPGDTLKQADLANSLQQISDLGTDAFYRGPIGDQIVKASSIKGGILAKQDFSDYKVREMAPVTCDYRGYVVISAPPPSSGGVILCELLNILETFPLSDSGYASAETTHEMIEAMRRAFADRNAALGDPDFVNNPVGKLIDKGYAKEIHDSIDPLRAGSSEGITPMQVEKPQTTHYSIVDKDGNAVAVTYTLNGGFGTGIVAPGTGILLNNEMDDFTAKPGVPNLYGLVQGEANAIAPGKTPLSSMSPTIITKDGKLFMVIGSPGGARIITITLEAIVNVIDFGMNIQEAIDAPRLHHQWMPEKVFMEPNALSIDTLKNLRDMGHDVSIDPNWTIWGAAAGILIGGKNLEEIEDGHGARLNGAMDSRSLSGAARGY